MAYPGGGYNAGGFPPAPPQPCGQVMVRSPCGQMVPQMQMMGGPAMGFPPGLMSPQQGKPEVLVPPSTTEIMSPSMPIPGRVFQRLDSIPVPRPCPRPGEFQQPYQIPHQVVVPRSRPVGTLEQRLEQRLASIPVPRACPLGFRPGNVQEEEVKPRASVFQPTCGIRRTVHSHEREVERVEALKEVSIEPVAGSWSDGIGGHKIKASPPRTGGMSSKHDSFGDGAGGRKIKGYDED